MEGIKISLSELKGEKGTIVMFICNHCPFVVHVIEEIVEIAIDYLDKGFEFVAINSNDVVNYPADAPDKMIDFAEQYNFPFPYLFDESQEVAKAYKAACTPDFSVFDKDLVCVYRGQLDDARPGNEEPNEGKDLRAVLEAMDSNTSVADIQKPSIGCGIKWK